MVRPPRRQTTTPAATTRRTNGARISCSLSCRRVDPSGATVFSHSTTPTELASRSEQLPAPGQAVLDDDDERRHDEHRDSNGRGVAEPEVAERVVVEVSRQIRRRSSRPPPVTMRPARSSIGRRGSSRIARSASTGAISGSVSLRSTNTGVAPSSAAVSRRSGWSVSMPAR